MVQTLIRVKSINGSNVTLVGMLEFDDEEEMDIDRTVTATTKAEIDAAMQAFETDIKNAYPTYKSLMVTSKAAIWKDVAGFLSKV